MVNLTKNFMRIVPTEKKKVQLIPEAIICHIDESTLFQNNVWQKKYYVKKNSKTNNVFIYRKDFPRNLKKT